jgi:hypothetical protein
MLNTSSKSSSNATPLNKCNLTQINAYLSTLNGNRNFSPLECDLSLSLSESCVLSPPLVDTCTYQAKSKDCNSPSKHAMNAEMHKYRSFKIIASKLKRCSSWYCHVYISTNTSASKCSKWSNETKYGIVASLIKFEQFKRGFTSKRAHSKYR